MQCQLVIVAGPDKGRTFPIEEGQTLAIGRGQASDTQINDPHMSRVHCRVQMDGGKVLLLDAGSSSGTFVAGQKIARQELKPGEMFQVGDTRIRYQFESTPEAATLGGEPLIEHPKPQATVTPLKDLVGQSLHNYRLDAIITAGVSGMIFKAYDTEAERVAAVKVLTPDFTNSEEQKERFVRAMKTMLPIRHPNIIQLYHAGKMGPYCYAAMQYVDGESLTQVIDRMGFAGMLDWREVWRRYTFHNDVHRGFPRFGSLGNTLFLAAGALWMGVGALRWEARRGRSWGTYHGLFVWLLCAMGLAGGCANRSGHGHGNWPWRRKCWSIKRWRSRPPGSSGTRRN